MEQSLIQRLVSFSRLTHSLDGDMSLVEMRKGNKVLRVV